MKLELNELHRLQIFWENLCFGLVSHRTFFLINENPVTCTCTKKFLISLQFSYFYLKPEVKNIFLYQVYYFNTKLAFYYCMYPSSGVLNFKIAIFRPLKIFCENNTLKS